MLCQNGLVKITDFGLAAFSRKQGNVPWCPDRKVHGGQLCAQLEGCTITYTSLQQRWARDQFAKVKEHDHAAFLALKFQWPVTPATSDCYAAALTVLEMHARAALWFGPSAIAPLDAADRCAARTPEATVHSMAPAKAEQWAVEQLGIDKLAGKIESGAINGGQLLDISKMGFAAAKKALKGMAPSVFASLKGVARCVSTPEDAMHEKILALAKGCLAEDVGARPAKARDALMKLGAKRAKMNRVTREFGINASTAHGVASLLPSATVDATEHPDENVAATLGGLAKALLLNGDVAGALAACAERLGASSNETARADAMGAFVNLWKRHGSELRTLELSRRVHGHWREPVLSGGECSFIRRLAPALHHCGAALDVIDLTEQKGLEGPALEIMVDEWAHVIFGSLHALSLENCQGATGTVPAAIGDCTMLHTLNLKNCKFTGASEQLLWRVEDHCTWYHHHAVRQIGF